MIPLLAQTIFNFYLVALRPTLGHYWDYSLTHPMLITAFYLVQPKGHQEPYDKVGSLSLAKHLAGLSQIGWNIVSKAKF